MSKFSVSTAGMFFPHRHTPSAALMDVGTQFSGEKYVDVIGKLQEEMDHRFVT